MELTRTRTRPGFSGELDRMFGGELDRMFSLFDHRGSQRTGWVPALDLVEEDGHYKMTADLPGLTEDDVSIELDGKVLTISGKREVKQERSEHGWYRFERSYGSFQRRVALPAEVDPEQITATFSRGVLEVRVPKTERQVARIPISAPAIEGKESPDRSDAKD